MKFVRPSPRQAETIVQAMYAVVSAEGTVDPIPLEIESIDAAQRHLLQWDPPLGGTPGPMPATLAADLDTDQLRRQTVRILALLPLVDRRILPGKVAAVRKAAAALGIDEYGLTILDLAAKGRFKRIAFGLMNRFVARFLSPTGKARLRDWGGFAWWMMPHLHGRKTTERNRALVERYKRLGDLPSDTFGYALTDFFAKNEIPLPGEATSVPWSLHETYHILGDYDVGLPEELLLTAFIGGTQDETCLDQMLFGLLAYHCGRPIIHGFVTEAILEPDDYFRALAHGTQSTINILSPEWDMWAIAPLPVPEVHRKYNLTLRAPRTRKVLNLPAERRGERPPMPTRLAVPWQDKAVEKALRTNPHSELARFGITVPQDIAVKTIGSRGHPADGIDTLLQFIIERGPQSSSFFMPSPLHPSGQQAAYGCFLHRESDDPVLEELVLEDSAAALRQVGVQPGALAVSA
jgi:hypothetical protein